MSSGREPPAIRLAARHGLVDEPTSLPLEGGDAVRALQLARSDRMAGLFTAAIDAGQIEASGSSADELRRLWHDQLRDCVAIEALTVRTSQMLTAAGVGHRLTKGAAVAHLDYRDPSLRPFADVDLVVHPDHWSTAVDTLTESGYRRYTAPLPGRYDERFGKGATLVAPGRLAVDLHRRFAIGRFGVTAHMHDVFREADSIVLAGTEIATLSAPDRLLHACYHAVLGGRPRLRAFRDVAQLLLVTAVDWEATFERARTWRADALVARAIMETWRRLELPIRHPALERSRSVEVSRRDAWALDQFTEPTNFRRQAITSITGLSVGDNLRFLATMTRAAAQRRRDPGHSG